MNCVMFGSSYCIMENDRKLRLVFCGLWACLALAAGVTPASGDDAPQVWLVSTRQIPHDGIAEVSPQSFCYLRLDEQWTESDADAFRAADNPAMPTVVFIHGNATSDEEAFSKGMFTYQTICAASCGKPFRFVIWSWPAGRICRRLYDDVLLKVDYSNVDSYYLATWLARIKPDVKVSLVGHSLGARIITGALHLLGGGEVIQSRLSEETVAAWSSGKPRAVRGMLLAAAIDFDWLSPGGCHDRALAQTEQVLVSCNHRDRVLRLYPLIYGERCGPKALGFVGPHGVDQSANIETINVSRTVGGIHQWQRYCLAANVSDRWIRYTFLGE